MPFFGGSSSSSKPSYMPSQENLKKVENIVYGGTMPQGYYQQPETQYFYKGNQIDEDKYNFYKNTWAKNDLSTIQGMSPFQQSRPSMTYQPGESGYNILGQQPPSYQNAYTRQGTQPITMGGLPNPMAGQPLAQGSMQPQGQNNIWSDKPVNANFVNQAEPYYSQIENNAINQAMTGARQGANAMASALGQRGIAQGGLGQMAGNQLASSLGTQLANISSNIGMQRAQDYNQLAQSGAELQNAMNQFNRQLDLQEQMQGRQMSLAERTQAMNEMINQYKMDQAARAEQYGYWKDPFNDQIKLLQLAMSLPSTSQGTQQGAMFQGVPGMTGYFGGLLG